MSPKFTPEIQKTIIAALEQNPSIPSAASRAEIHTTTLRAWIEKGEQGHEEYAGFALECTEARQVMKDEIVAALFKTATDELHPQQTKAAHQLLTNLFPAEFANVKHTVVHKDKGADELNVSALPTEELRQFLATLKKIRSGDEPEQKAQNVIDVVSSNGKG
jgi:hypothetical protein